MVIDKLPKKYKTLARKHSVYKNENRIDEAFIWDNTPEGHDFWEGVHEAYDEQELPPLPKTQ